MVFEQDKQDHDVEQQGKSNSHMFSFCSVYSDSVYFKVERKDTMDEYDVISTVVDDSTMYCCIVILV